MKKLTILFIISCICSMLNSITFLIEGNIPAFVGWFTTGLAICLLSTIVGGWNGPKARYEAEIAKYKRDLLESMARESIANKVLSNKREEITRLTRWHDPNEEMPDNNHCVLIKISDGQQERIYIGSREGDVWIADGGNSFHADPASSIGFDGVIIGWREIHE